jgi:hypothetical protein
MMNVHTDHSVIKNSTCDDCGRKGPGTEYYSMGSPVYFACNSCAPKHFERQARKDIDRWLNGEDL